MAANEKSGVSEWRVIFKLMGKEIWVDVASTNSILAKSVAKDTLAEIINNSKTIVLPIARL